MEHLTELPELWINIVLLAFLLVTAFTLIHLRNLFAIIMLAGIYSLLSASIFLELDAVDVAFTEASVGTGISSVLMLATLSLVGKRERKRTNRSFVPLLIVSATGAALIFGTLDMPRFGDPNAPIHHHVADYYVQESGSDIGVPNIVTSVLASYRGYDTLGETAVIFTAAIAIMILLGYTKKPEKSGRTTR